MIRRPPRSTLDRSSAASDVYKRQALDGLKKIQSNNPSEYFVENIIQPEDETIKLIKPTKNFTRISNILLLILFLGLGIIVFNVVKSILSENKDKTDTEALSYTQDYSKNPNYSNSTNWIINKVPTSNNLKSICFIDDYNGYIAVSYTHLRAHETVLDIVCRLLLEKKTTTRCQSSHTFTPS